MMLFVFLFLLGNPAYSQLSDLHYLPPLKQRVGNFSDNNQYAIVDQAVYLSTPETVAFDVEVFQGSNPVKIATLSVSNSSPVKYVLAQKENNITLVTNENVAKVLTSSGLIFKSPSEKKFYVNYRGRSPAHATSLTSKGRDALGTAFKWGGVPNRGTNYSLVSVSLGIMATTDNTQVSIFGYDPGVTFRNAAGESGLTDDNLSITLNKGESYTLEVIQSSSNAKNIDGWIGASIISSKDIAVSVGQLHMQSGRFGNQDAGTDQITPESKVGSDYVFVRGVGQAANEYAVLVATENNTNVYLNGSVTPAATINEGEYYEVASSNYSGTSAGSNMYVSTSKPVYAFQSLAGNNFTNTTGLNFIAPVNCLLDSRVDNIVDVTDIAGLVTSGGLFLVASSLIPAEEINVKVAGVSLATSTLKAARRSVSGTSDWVTYYLPGLKGNVSVYATGPIAVGFFGYNSNGGVAGYFSGFETIPNVLVQLVGDGCLPGTTLVATEGFDDYTWFKNGNLIPDATGNTYMPTSPGSYNLVVSTGTCSYESASQIIVDCYPEVVVSTTADKPSAQPTETITFTIKSQYLGFDQVNNLMISFSIPEGLIYQSSDATVGTVTSSSGTYQWNIGTLFSGQEPVLHLITKVNPALASSGEVTLSVTNSQDGSDANRVEDDLSETVLLNLKPLPTLSKFKNLNKIVRDGSFVLRQPQSNSTGNFIFTSSNPAVASISGNIVTLNGTGSTILKAQQADDGSFDRSFIEAELVVNESNSLLTKSGEISAIKPLVVSAQGNPAGSLGLTKYGSKLQVEKSPAAPDSDLVLWLDSDRIASYNRKNNIWYDLSSKWNHGFLINKVGFGASNARSFGFNGTNQFVSFEDGFSPTENLTLEAWVYPTGLQNETLASILAQNGSAAGTFNFQFSGSRLELVLNGTGTYASTFSFSVQSWYHVVVVYSKSNPSVRFYVNGNLTNQITLDGTAPALIEKAFSAGSLDGLSRFFKGNIGLVKIYTRSFSDLEVNESFAATKSRFGF